MIESKFIANQFRQGDALATPITEPDADTTDVPRDAGRVVLEYGEVTGHAHAIHDLDARLTRTAAGDRVLEVLASTVRLQHEEHATIDIPKGLYQIERQREYTPEGLRNVQD